MNRHIIDGFKQHIKNMLSSYGRLKIEAKKIDRTLSNFRFNFEKT